MQDLLKFSPANAKLKSLYKVSSLKKYLKNNRKVYSLDLLSGWSCPFANECLAKVRESNGRFTIEDGSNTKFRCYSASQEVIFPAVRRLREYNFNLLKGKNYTEIIRLLQTSLPNDLGILRLHSAGDFYSKQYFYAIVNFASLHPDKLFYGYTKSLPYWVQYKSIVDKIPNLVLTASLGGRCDNLIQAYNLRSAKVIFHPSEANNLPVDHTDVCAANPINRNKDFCLLLHGKAKAGSEASRAISRLNKEGIKYAYTR